ncbi:MAG: hypothetical protein RSC28_08965 [Bacteroidales bacterium]
MKRTAYILFIFLFGCNLLFAQQKTTVKVKSEITYDKILPLEMMREFNDYKDGCVYYKNGSVTNSSFNYNLFTGAILFKNKDGKELELAFPEHITMVMIDNSYWVPINGGFGKIIYNKDSLDLIKFRATRCTDIRKEGAFGSVSSTSAISSVSSIQSSSNNSRQPLAVVGEYDFEVEVTYFIKMGDNIVEANVKGIKKIFPKSKNIISNIIKSNNFNLSNEKDIIELLKSL